MDIPDKFYFIINHFDSDHIYAVELIAEERIVALQTNKRPDGFSEVGLRLFENQDFVLIAIDKTELS